MESWIEHLTYIRNICAHHGRLWNRILIVTPTIPRHTVLPWISQAPQRNDKLYLSICLITYMLKRITPTSNIKGKLLTLINRLPSIDLRAAGFPPTWRNDLFWKEIYVPWSYKARILLFQCRNLYITP
ncbi:Abi family protein [Paraflavitalea speifideaquila]|uniref:Abi family protein n=1 Tax=Paraflavitalea speifideaquila TaxID=3076558 RepID=UPI003312FAE3